MEINFTNVTKTYGQTKVIDNLNYIFRGPNLYIVTGNSGSGKTTIINLICGSLKTTTGQVIVNKSINKKLNNNVSVIMQKSHLYDFFTIEENVLFPFLLIKKQDEIVKNKVDEYLKLLQIYEMRNRKAKLCSGGECQRANILRTLLNDKSIIVFDEPTAMVDSVNSQIIKDIISKLSLEKLVILVTHDYDVFISLKHIHLHLENGSIINEKTNL